MEVEYGEHPPEDWDKRDGWIYVGMVKTMLPGDSRSKASVSLHNMHYCSIKCLQKAVAGLGVVG
jgi:hypothetical protein